MNAVTPYRELIDTADSDLSLKDRLRRPLRDLRISVTDRCNFRCQYCMPADRKYQFLKKSELLSREEIVRLARIFVALGVNKLRITGGEPLLRPDLAELIRELNAIEGLDDIALTTNGSLLAEQAQGLKDAGLQRVTVSLDSLDEKTFRSMTGGRECLQQVLEGIEEAKRVGLSPVKVNAVVLKGTNDHTMLELLDYFRNKDVVVRLVEFMDVGSVNQWDSRLTVPSSELVKRINRSWPIVPVAENYSGEVAKRYLYKDGAGEIGFISSVTRPFCNECSRARLSARGKMYSCLFASDGMDLMSSLRQGADDLSLLDMIAGEWSGRANRYSMDRTVANENSRTDNRIEMFYIGG